MFRLLGPVVLALATLAPAPAAAEWQASPAKPTSTVAAQPVAKALTNDPVGDTFGSPPTFDVTAMSASATSTEIVIQVDFTNPVRPASEGQSASVYGAIELDTDRN